MKKQYSCKEIEKLFPKLLNKELDIHSLQIVLDHIETCPECKEEFSIQYLVREGISILENGGNFDLQNGLETFLLQSRRKIKRARVFTFLTYFLEFVALLTVIIILFMVVFY